MTMNDQEQFFQPTFGARPQQIVGRDGILTTFAQGLRAPVGSRDRCMLFLGQRGMGKTALLLEMDDMASKSGYVTARVTAHDGMASVIIEQVQLNGSVFFKEDKKQLTGINIGAMGFTFGLTFSDAARKQYGFRTKLSLLCDRLKEKDQGILILIDEVHTSEAMREVAASYQELVGDGKNIAIVMAGLPSAVSSVLNDKVLTFLNRATKMKLGPISTEAINAYYHKAFRKLGISCKDEYVNRAAEYTRGLPYLMQLVGYYLVLYADEKEGISTDILEKALKSAKKDLDDNVFQPTLAPLSDNDRRFLAAMAQYGGAPVTTSQLKASIGDDGPAIQPYRKRLIDAGIIESPRRGELVFSIPFFADYLRDDYGAFS